MCAHPPPPPRQALPPRAPVNNGQQQGDGDNGGFRVIDVHAPTAGASVGMMLFIICIILLFVFCFRNQLARVFCSGFGYAHHQLTPYAAPYYPQRCEPYYPQQQIEMRFVGPHAGAAGLNAAPNAAAVHRIQEVPATPVAREAPLRLDAPPAAANNRQIRV